ncbi:MAG: hypothetical protein J5958_04935 [Clostridia bacterium]|nr:hypothetical protein [Clostridia bacterium]
MTKRMKRVILFSSVVILMTAFVFLMAACSLGGTEGGGETPAPSATGIEVTVADGSTLTWQGGKIVMVLGQIQAVAKGDLSVALVYSDGTKQPITDFSIDASSVTNDAAAGSYTVVVTYREYTAMITVNVVDPRVPLPSIETTEVYSFEYRGSSIDIVEMLDEDRADADKIATLLAEGKVTVAEGENYTRTATNTGDYLLCIRASDGYVFGDETTGLVTEQIVSWNITKKVVPIPTADGTTSFVYTGSEITLPVNAHGFDEVITFINGNVPTNKATNANQGNNKNLCVAIIKSECEDNYIFEGNQYAVEVAEWTITPKPLAYPTVLNGKKVTEAETDYYHFDYNEGQPVAMQTSVDDLGLFLIEGLSSATYVNGSYFTVDVVLDENVAVRENYRWEDGAEITGPITFRVVVDPIDYVLPQAVAAATLYAETEYRPGGDYTFDACWLDLTAATRQYLTEEGVWTDDSSLTYNDTATFAAGTRTLQYLFQHSQNYNPTAINLTVTVKPASVNLESVSWNGRQNVEQANNWYNVGTGNFIYNGLPQRKALDLTIYSDYLNEEGLYPIVTYNVYYGTTAGVYGSTPIQTVTVTANERGEFLYDYAGVGAVNAGYYKTVATLSVAGGNYVFVDGEQELVTSLTTTWQIEKATLIVYPNFSGTFGAWIGNGYYSYYTGENKTIALAPCNAIIETYYNAYGEKTRLYTYGNSGDFDLADFVDFNTPTTYFYNGGWQVAENTSAIGRYKTTLDVQLKAGVAANYALCVDYQWTDDDYLEWSVLNNEIDATGMIWVNEGTYAYGTGKPYLIGLPAGLIVSYCDTGENGYQGGNVGLNRYYVYVDVNSNADGYEGVTITLPAGWTHNEDYYTHEIQYNTGTGSTEYTLTKRILTLDDFYLVIDDQKIDAPYELVYDGNYHFSGIGSDDGFDDPYWIGVERGDWNADGHGCYGSQTEVDTYTFSGFLYFRNDPYGNYGFDESEARLLTEDYVYGGGDNTFVLSVTGDDHGASNVVYLDYAYVLDFSFTWSIVAPEN